MRREPSGVRILLVLAALTVVVAGLRASGELLLPFLVAAFLSILSAPPVLWLERRLRIPAAIAVLLVMFGVVGVVLGFGALLGRSVRGFSKALPHYETRLGELEQQVRAWVVDHGFDLGSFSVHQLDPSSLIAMVQSTLAGLVTALADTTLVLLTMVFMLLEAAALPAKMRLALNDPDADLGRFARVSTEVQRYLGIKTLISIGTGASVWVAMWAMGVDFPLLWGLTAFLFNYIPNVGSVIAAIPAVLVALLQLGVGSAVGVALVYTVANTVFGNVVEPQLMGRKLGLSPLVVFLSLVFWGWVWGPVGMLLSVPLTMIVKIMLEQTEDFRWVAVLLDAPPEAPPGAAPGRPSEAIVSPDAEATAAGEPPAE